MAASVDLPAKFSSPATVPTHVENDCESVTGIVTPTETEAPFEFVDSKVVLAARWNEALLKCKEDLSLVSRADLEKIQSFDSVQVLLDDLRKREQECSKAWLSQATFRVLPAVKALSTTAAFFMGAMLPNSMETALVWGLLHLTMKLSLDSKQKWDDFVDRLDKIRCSLEVLNRCARCFEHEEGSHEMSAAIFDVFVNLINFWVEAVKWIRQHPMEKVAKDVCSSLNKKFEIAMIKVEGAIKHLSALATLDREAEIRLEQKNRQAELVSRIQMADETVEFPIKIVPWPAYRGFYGRKDIIDKIETLLNPKNSTGQPESVLIHGLGGVGKTQTALAFAHKMPSPFDAVFWIHSETQNSLKASFTQIATGLKLPGARLEGQDNQNLLYFQGWLRTQAARGNGRKWLLIFDNCESIEDISPKYIPVTPGSILITSRHPLVKLRDTFAIQIKPFSESEGLGLIKQLLKWDLKDVMPDEELALPKILQKVDGLPLGIQQIAALMNMRDLSAKKFLQFYNKHARRLLKDAKRATDYDKDVGRTVGSEHVLDNVWRMSFETLSWGATSLIGVLSLLSPDCVPIGLFCCKETESAPLPTILSICEDEYELDNAVIELHQAALIDKDDSTLSIHRLVQEAFIYSRSPECCQEYFDAAVLLVHQSFPQQINGRPMHDHWEQCRSFIQHGVHLAERFREYQTWKPKLKPSALLGELLKSCAWYLFEMAEHNATLALLQIAFEACVDKQSELYAHLLNTAGCSSFELNDLDACRKAWEQALKLREKFAESGDPCTEEELANQLNNFGNLESAEGNIEEALALFNRAEGIRLRLGADAIVPLAVTHMTTGRAYFLKKEYSQALKRYSMAEGIFLEKFGPTAHFMAHLNYARGNLELKRGENLAARAYYDSSLKILEDTTPLHLLLSACYYKKASLYQEENEDDAALKLLHKALVIAEFQRAQGDAARIIKKQERISERLNSKSTADVVSMNGSSAELMRIQLPGQKPSNMVDTDEAWDNLVCGYWR